MAGRIECRRYELTLDDLLDDEIMAPVLRSAGFDSRGFREMMIATARRIDDRRVGQNAGHQHDRGER